MRSPDIHRVVPAAIAIACATAFAALAAVVGGGPPLPTEAAMASLVVGTGVPVEAWRLITDLGATAVVLAVGAAEALGLFAGGRRASALVAVAAVVGSVLAADVMKDVVERPRPPGPWLVPADGFAFPSAHALGSSAAYGLLALLAGRSRLRPSLRAIAVAAAGAVVVLVGLSRIALGVHYPTDVLGGWLAGLGVVAAVAATRWPDLRARGAASPGRRA